MNNGYGGLCPWIDTNIRAEIMTSHYREIAGLIKGEFIGKVLKKEEVLNFKAKELYKNMKRGYPIPRAQLRIVLEENKWEDIWKRAVSSIYTSIYIYIYKYIYIYTRPTDGQFRDVRLCLVTGRYLSFLKNLSSLNNLIFKKKLSF